MPQTPYQVSDGQGNILEEGTVEVSQESVNAEALRSKLAELLSNPQLRQWHADASAMTQSQWGALSAADFRLQTFRLLKVVDGLLPPLYRLARIVLDRNEADEPD